jgi:hypothetical protein
MPTNNPRFRSAHDAGNFIAAQLYDYARGLNPEDFGAIPRYIENPEWLKASFEVVVFRSTSGEEVHSVKDPVTAEVHESKLKTPQEWYASSPFSIVIAADKPDYENFNEWWNFAKITNQEFAEYLSTCTLLD